LRLAKRFGRTRALEDVTFEVKDGEYLCVLGSTGSGKTTLLRLIAGIIKPDEGEIFMDDERVNEVPAEERNAVYVPQTYALFPHMTVLENVMFGPMARQTPAKEASEAAMRVLKLVRLDHRADAFPNELSGGMQQRVALARGLAPGFKLLLLDEPLGALDARLRLELRGELRRLAKESGLTVIHVTHDQEEAMTVADRILVLRMGRVQQHGTPFHVYNRPENVFVANFVGRTNFLEGIIEARNREKSTVKLRGNLYFDVADMSHEDEEDVIVAVREENTLLTGDDPGEGRNVLDGEVTQVYFLGAYIRLEVRLRNGDVVSSLMPTDILLGKFRVGDRVWVSFYPGSALVYDYPTLGLRHELEAY
jgi:ABC-type Fe3+/spermidine/putrescine transport system ATPase subunit